MCGVWLEERTLQNFVDLYVSGQRDVSRHARRLELPAQLKLRIDLDASELVTQYFEVLRGNGDLERADAQFVSSQTAFDLERLAPVVLQMQRFDGDLTAIEAQHRAAVLVACAGRGHQKPGVRDCHGPVEMRIAARADRAHVELRLSRDVADDVGDPFDESEVDGARLDRDVDRLLWSFRIEDGERQRSIGGQPRPR